MRPKLYPGDTVELIAPASRCKDQHVKELVALLNGWQLNCLVNNKLFGDDLLCANSDVARFENLKQALFNAETKALICVRGGYGSMRLIPKLTTLTMPVEQKIFLGMSDVTALNLFLMQHWKWPVLHGALAVDKFSPESIAAMKPILLGEAEQVHFPAVALNEAAKQEKIIHAPITGGNLCLVETSIGTFWQMEATQQMIFFEEVGERGYQIDRRLTHLEQAGMLRDAQAIIFGDFLRGDEPDGRSLIHPVLLRFAEQQSLPVVQIAGVGHGYQNRILPMGTLATLRLGKNIHLECRL